MTTEGGREAGRLRSILDASDDAIVTTDLDGRVIDWNDRAAELFGWTADEVRGRSVGSFLVPDYARDTFFRGLDAYRETGDSLELERHLETTALCEDGREIPIEASTSVVTVAGEVVCAMFLRDLSDRHTEKEFNVRRMLETKLIHQTSSTSTDVESVVITALEVACQVTGRLGGLAFDVRGKRIAGLTSWFAPEFEDCTSLAVQHGESRTRNPGGLLGEVIRTKRSISRAATRLDPELFAIRDWGAAGVRRFDGIPIVVDGVVEIVLLLLSGDGGDPTRECSVLTRNVAIQLARFLERQRREDERARLAAIVDGSYDAIIGKSMKGRILSWNDGARRVYGYTAEEAVGRSINILLPEGVATEEPKIIDATRSGRRLTEFETWRRHASGRDILVSITVSPIKDSRGRIIGASTIERDVTRRRERELQLREAVEAAERANRIKGEFLANISHELRTPMNAIIGMLDLALGEDLDGVMRDYLDTARDSAGTLLYLLNDLLDFSRMEAGRFELDDEPYRFRDTIDAVAKTLSLRAHEKGLELACRIASGVPDVQSGDGRRLRQVLMNLVGNAIKFTEQGEIVVNAEVSSREGASVVIRVTVRDTGVGIAEEDRERIFDAFSQADASSTRHHQGSGLGLAIVRELVQKMQGQVEVESVPGEGSTFGFTFRAAVLADRGPTPDEREAAVAELRGLPVLVVDDNATNRTIVAEMLQNWNMRPIVVECADEAIERLRAARANDEPFPLVVVDALMPETDGFELVRRIREEALTARGTVLMLSSADRQAFKDKTDELQVDTFLEKPVSQSAMLDVIMTSLRGPQLDQGAVQKLVATTRSLRLLVAEDTPANQKVVRSILEKRGHVVDIAHNGREALDLHESREYDAILMDVQMPTMDGLQATRAIRELADAGRASIPVIAMTAHAMQGDRERCLASGMDGYLSKPIDAQQMVRLVEEMAARDESETFSSGAAPRSPTTDDVPFDRGVALTRLGGDEELLHDLYGYYREDTVVLLESLRTELAAGRTTEAHRAAHSLKGLSANLEANEARDAAADCERALANGETARARAGLVRLERAVAAVVASFDTN